MSRPGLMVYKCRRCGGLDMSSHVPDIMFGVISATTGTSMAWGSVSLLTTHSCPDGGFGVADLTGGEACAPTCCKVPS